MQGVDNNFANSFGNYLLHGIEEVQLPQAISWWPQTLAWQLLGLLCLGLLTAWVYHQAKRLWRNRYRRQALKQLSALENNASHWQQVVAQLPHLLKATALKAYPRSDVAQLSGQSWLRFLEAHYSGPAFSDKTGQQLLVIAYQPPERWCLTDAQAQRLTNRARTWIREHKQVPHV
jgi:hypothetical protein